MTGVRHIEVSMASSGVAHPVCISPGQNTLFSFDADLAPGSLSLEGGDGFTKVEPGVSTLKLVPSEKVPLGKPLKLTVRFADNAAPSSAAFVLVAHGAQAEPLIEVHRQTRTVESYQQEVRAMREEARQLREEVARLRADKAGPGGFAGALLSGAVGQDGVASQNLTQRLKEPPTNPLRVQLIIGFRSTGRMALDLWLGNPEGAQAWTAEGAALALESKRSGPPRVLTVWQEAPIPPGQSGRVVVEAEPLPDGVRGPYTLKLWEAGGERTVTLGGVTFP
jgi:uncharacterized protein (TIGR02268 family)